MNGLIPVYFHEDDSIIYYDSNHKIVGFGSISSNKIEYFDTIENDEVKHEKNLTSQDIETNDNISHVQNK